MKEKRKWIIIDSGTLSGARNMETDRQLLEKAEKGSLGPTLRFYRWQPPAVSLGAAQKAEEEIDEGFCRDHGVDVVRRPSGGGAILHEDELTYAFISRTDEHPEFRDLLGSYYALLEGLRRGLAMLGVKTDLRGGDKDGGPEKYQPCFALSSRHDLTCAGKKIIGSAQRRRRAAFLQHGSLPYSYDKKLVRGVFLRPEKFFERATSLCEIMGRRPADEEVKSSLAEGIAERFEVKLIPPDSA